MTYFQPYDIDTSITYQKKRPNRLLPIVIGVVGLCVLFFVLYLIIGNNRGKEEVDKSQIWQETVEADRSQVTQAAEEADRSQASQVTEESYYTDKTEEISLDLYYYHSLLSNDDRELYDVILEGVRELDTSIILPANIEDKLHNIIQMIWNDHPELFWVDSSYQYTTYEDKTDLQLTYLYGRGEIKSRTKEIEATVNEFNRLLTDKDTDYDVVKKVYLYLIDTVEYVLNSSDNQNIYSSLVNRESVCAGYSKATQYLLQRSGIQALYVSGMANGSYGWDGHSWNIVLCDGQYYQVDTTFGDGYTSPDIRMSELDIHNLAYLCINDDIMYRNHQVSRELTVPTCNSMNLNYYVQNGLYSDDFDEQVMQSMRDSIFDGENSWCYQFSNYEAYSACLKSIQEGAYSSIVSKYLNDACRTWYLNDDAMYYVLCWY